MAMSVDAGRSEISDHVRDIIFQCTLCGGCDMACKFSSDIEVLETLYALRAESFKRRGPSDAHQQLLEGLDRRDACVPATGSKGAWLREAGISPVPTGDLLLYVGCHMSLLPEHRRTLLTLVSLLGRAGYRFSVLGDREPCCGRAVLEIGDLERFDRMARRTLKAFRDAGVKKVVCTDPHSYATFRGHYPKVESLDIEVCHVVELLAEAVRDGRLKCTKPFPKRVAYHDPCHLGRLGETLTPWNGEIKKLLGQLVVYDPPRPVNRGTQGCYEPPRDILDAIPGVERVEFERRREYAYCCGGGAAVPETYPELASFAAKKRLEEAEAVGAEAIVTACPGCRLHLGGNGKNGRLPVRDIVEVLAESVEGGVR